MITYSFLQHYWWFIISLLGALLVFLLFVQGGQGLLYTIGKTSKQRNLILNSLGRKWETTFTTLVTFGGAFFASFPLFYSTSFGGAFYVWMLILFVFVLQAVGYEFRRKPNNFLGERTYDAFLMINGIAGTFLLGVAVGTFFTGANFIVDRMNLTNVGGDTVISQWTNGWRGLDALADYRNVCLGLAVVFLSRVLGSQYLMNSIEDAEMDRKARRQMIYNAVPFLIFFLTFLISIMFATGVGTDPDTGVMYLEKYKYFHNLIAMPIVLAVVLAGVLLVLYGLFRGIVKCSDKAIWFSGTGTVLTVLALLLCAGYNNTAYYPSLADLQSSLTIYNSSSSEFTLTVMSVVSLLIPFVFAYIWYAWRSINRVKVTEDEIGSSDEHTY